MEGILDDEDDDEDEDDDDEDDDEEDSNEEDEDDDQLEDSMGEDSQADPNSHDDEDDSNDVGLGPLTHNDDSVPEEGSYLDNIQHAMQFPAMGQMQHPAHLPNPHGQLYHGVQYGNQSSDFDQSQDDSGEL